MSGVIGMNRGLYRVVFSAARGQRMVVAETAVSHTCTGSSSGSAARSMVTTALSAVAAGVLLLCGAASAQIKADPSAPASQRPIILQTANGTPLVQITTPSAAGVSRNSFSQFDVQSNGAILNNVRANAAQTAIGGLVQSNPYLATGAARVILGEVNSSNPTYLNGPTEVAGQRAEVIIANPSGIRINGGAFLNASGVTLTTGKPVFNAGNLEAFRVTQGTVAVAGLGLDTSTADYSRILARAIEVNAGVWAKHLTVIAGTNEVSALASGTAAIATPISGSGAAPNFMLDVAAIGGMYAGHIYLVGTEAGLGVNNNGSLVAQQSDLVLAVNGKLLNKGTIQAQGDLLLSAAGGIENVGDMALINSQGKAKVTSGSDVVNADGASITAVQALTLDASGRIANTNQALLASNSTLNINAADALLNKSSTIAADGAVQVAALGIDNSLGTIASVQSTLGLNANNLTLINEQGTITSAQSVLIESSMLNNDKGLIQAGAALSVNTHGDQFINTNAAGHSSGEGGVVAGGVATLLTGDLVNDAGYIGANGALALTSAGQVSNASGNILSGHTLALTAAGALTNTQGAIQSVSDATIDTHGSALDNTAGKISSQGKILLEVGALTNGVLGSQEGRIASIGELSLHANSVINSANGATKSEIWSGQLASLSVDELENAGVISGGSVKAISAGSIVNHAGASIEANRRLELSAATSLSNAGQLIANQYLGLQAQDIHNSGNVEATDANLIAGNTFINTATGSVSAALSIEIGAVHLVNQGLINANEANGTSSAYLHAETIDNTGTGAIFGDRVAISANSLNNRPEIGNAAAPVIAARQQLDLGIHTLNNEDGALIYSGGDMAIGGEIDQMRLAAGQANDVNNVGGSIEAEGGLVISTDRLLNERRNVSVEQVTSIDSTVEMALAYWQGNSHGERPITNGHFNYRAFQSYYLDPASIQSVEEFITPDGKKIGKAVVQLTPEDSVFYVASGASGNRPIGQRARQVISAPETRVIYFIGSLEGVANPDQVSGGLDPDSSVVSVVQWEVDAVNYSNSYGRCTTNCIRLVTPLDYTDPVHTIVGRLQHPSSPSGNEQSRTAHHTAVDEVLNSNAGELSRISSGGAMQINVKSSLTNRYGDIQAGKDLLLEATGASVVNEGRTLYRIHSFYNTTHAYNGSSYSWTNPDISEVLEQLGGSITSNASLTINSKNLANTNLQKTTALPTSGLNFIGVNLSSTSPAITVSPSTLYRPANPGQHYLVESDPRFTDYRQWMGSDYMLNALGNDPNAIQKRLGDGFYEQKLIREQVAELTGRRFLDGYTNEEAQYQALMDAGVTYAKQWGLTPGVALTAEQMAALTTDLVWLVEREVILQDGTTTRALVPQVYVRQVNDGEITPAGALIAGNDVQVNVANDIVNNGGTLAGRSLSMTAGRDISNIGGTMQATQVLVASAGRDITVSSPTFSSGYQGSVVTQSRTELAGVGAMRVVGDGSGGVMAISAGNDINLQSAAVANSSKDGTTQISAGNDINLTTVTTSSASSSVFDRKNYYSSRDTQEIGTSIAVQGDLVLKAGNDIKSRAATVDAGGALAVGAARDVVIDEGRTTSESTFGAHSSSSNLLSKSSSTERRESSSNTAIGSSFNGDSVDIRAGQDLIVQGSTVNAVNAASLSAGRDVVITSTQNSESNSSFSEVKKSGFSISREGLGYGKSSQQGTGNYAMNTQAGSSVTGGEVSVSAGRDVAIQASTVVADNDLDIFATRDVSIVAGTNTSQSEQTNKSKSTMVGGFITSGLGKGVTLFSDNKTAQNGASSGTTAAASTVGSLGGDVNILAGQRYTQTGSDVVAPQGDIGIHAATVEIAEARETAVETSYQSSKSVTLGARPSNPVIDLVLAAKNTVDTAVATATTGKGRVQAIGAAATALNAYNTGKAAMDLATSPGKAASISIEFQLGTSKSKSSSAQTSDAGRGSSVAAGGDVTIVASSAGSDSDLHVRGSEIAAGRNVNLKAEGDVLLESSQDKGKLESSNKSSGGSLGVGISFGGNTGISFSASVNGARGNADGADVIQQNTHVVAGNTVTIQSGADTTLAGATVTAPTVKADVGGDLTIESRQDVSTFESQQKSFGAGVSLCIPPLCYGVSSVSASGGKQNIDSDFQSVTEQSGIRAGDGGFQVNVAQNTTLVGGAITSSDLAVSEGKNSFSTDGTLTISDIQNRANYQGDGFEFNTSIGFSAGDQSTAKTDSEKKSAEQKPVNSGSAGIGEDSSSASSITTSGISGIAGNEAMRTGDAETGINPIFDKEKVQRELDAQIKITTEFGKNASSAWGKLANEMLADAIKAEDAEAIACWSSDGACRVAGHSVIGGLTGGVSGAMGAAIGSYSASKFAELAKSAGLSGAAADSLTALLTTTAGAITAGASGAGTALNEVMNNYLTSSQWNQLVKDLEACGENSSCKRDVRDKYAEISGQQDQAMQEACKDIASEACRSHVIDALAGTSTQLNLVQNKQLPDSYMAGMDFNAGANLIARNAFKADLHKACAASSDCIAKNEKALLVIGNTLLDLAPIIGDIKAFVEAETPFDYILAAIGSVGPIGDGFKKIIQEGKTLYKAGDIAGAAEKLKEASAIEVISSVGTVSPTIKGFINSSKLSEAAVIPTDTFTQRLIISDIVANLDKSGVKTESLMDFVLKADPNIKVLEGAKYHGNNGFDHVIQFVDPNDGVTKTMIIESKQLAKNGSSSLNPKSAGGVLQLSDESINVVLRNLDGSPAGLAIQSAMNNGTLLKALSYVDKATNELKIVQLGVAKNK